MKENSPITRENLNKLVVYLAGKKIGQIINKLPPNVSLKKKAISGFIKQPVDHQKIDYSNLTRCLSIGSPGGTIDRFEQVLQTELSHCDLSSFYRNIEKLEIDERIKTTIEKLKEFFGNYSIDGLYYAGANKIISYKKLDCNFEDEENSRTHELLHLSSSAKDKNNSYCGFSKYNIKTGIEVGRGLTEGFTEYLNIKYFAKRDRGHYPILTGIVGQMSYIIGQKEMEQFYFTNDLEGVIKGLEKYTSKEKAVELILKMDEIYKSEGILHKKKYKDKMEEEAIVDVANIVLEKYKQKYNAGKMSEQAYKNNIYKLELFVHYASDIWYHKEDDKLIGITLSDSSAVFLPLFDISKEEYIEKANHFFDSLQGNINFSYIQWIDSDGKSTDDYIEEKMEIQRQKTIELLKQQNLNSSTPTQQETKKTEYIPLIEQELSEMLEDKKELPQQKSQNLTPDQELQQMMKDAAEPKAILDVSSAQQGSPKK